MREAGVLIGALCLILPSIAARQAVTNQFVDISVLDKENVPVTDLKIGEVAVEEDGVARDIVRLEPQAPPADITWMVEGFPVDPERIVMACQTLRDKRVIGGAIVLGGGVPDKAEQSRVTDALKEAGASLWVLAADQPTEFDPLQVYAYGDPTITGRTDLVPRSPQFSSNSNGASDAAAALEAAKKIAAASGGRYLDRAKSFTRESVAAMLATEYRVTYRRLPSPKAPEKLEVKVSRKDTTVAAPSWAPAGSR